MFLPKSDISDFGTEKILENYKPENYKTGYFRRKSKPDISASNLDYYTLPPGRTARNRGWGRI